MKQSCHNKKINFDDENLVKSSADSPRIMTAPLGVEHSFQYILLNSLDHVIVNIILKVYCKNKIASTSKGYGRSMLHAALRKTHFGYKFNRNVKQNQL